MPDLEIHPATPDRTDDLADLFATHAGTRGCWCLAHILPRKEHVAGWGNGENRRKFEALQRDADPPMGLIAYEDGKPIAWCAMGPRTRYPTTTSPRATIYRDRDPSEDDDVWVMTCFFVRVGHRRSGATHALLEAAVEIARKHGAKAVEGLPIADDYGKERDAYVGRESLFAACGFERVAHPSPRRVIMRRDL
jgi:GNAT superfamily N-acetyltransferase